MQKIDLGFLLQKIKSILINYQQSKNNNKLLPSYLYLFILRLRQINNRQNFFWNKLYVTNLCQEKNLISRIKNNNSSRFNSQIFGFQQIALIDGW